MSYYLVETKSFNKAMSKAFGKDLCIEWYSHEEVNSDLDYILDNYIYSIEKIYSKDVSPTGIISEKLIYDISDDQFGYVENSFVTPLQKSLSISDKSIMQILCKKDEFNENGIPLGEKVCVVYYKHY